MTPEERARQEVLLAAQKLASGQWALTPGVWRRAEVELKAEARPPEDRLLAVLKDVKADLLRALEAGPSAAVRKHIDEALSGIAGAEVLPEQHKSPAERVQELDDHIKSVVQKQADDALDVMLKQVEVRTKAMIGSPLPRSEELTAQEIRRAMRRVEVDARAAHEEDEDATTSALKRKFAEELQRAKKG